MLEVLEDSTGFIGVRLDTVRRTRVKEVPRYAENHRTEQCTVACRPQPGSWTHVVQGVVKGVLWCTDSSSKLWT
jgi:hypothetical protein